MAKIDLNEPCPCGSGFLFKACHGPKVRTQKIPEITEHIPLAVISEPDPGSRAIFEKTGEGTVLFQGFETGIALVCGKCQASLAAGLNRSQIHGIVLRCKNCGSFNET
jgi:hypothetical protein